MGRGEGLKRRRREEEGEEREGGKGTYEGGGWRVYHYGK